MPVLLVTKLRNFSILQVFFFLKGATAQANAATSFIFTNPKISECAKNNRANGVPWLTASNASFICTDAQWNDFYDPASSIAYGAMDPDGGPAALTCPTPNTTIQCFVFASFGQVAGGPDACTDSCSLDMLTGSSSCCAQACTASGNGGFNPPSAAAAKCSDNVWMPGTTEECGSEFSGGFCDCCPDCYSCVHGEEPSDVTTTTTTTTAAAEGTTMTAAAAAATTTMTTTTMTTTTTTTNPGAARELVDNRFCDCRSGLDVAPDYAPCWNSCLDCLGDDGDVSYMPADVAAGCVNQASCFLYGTQAGNQGTWYSCADGDAAACNASAAGTVIVPDNSKVKAAALCG
jgi:hypothetical protein